MEFIGVYDMRETFAKVIEAAQKTPHVVLNFNRPKAMILGADGKDVLTLIQEAGVNIAAGRANGSKPLDAKGIKFVKHREAREQLSRVLKDSQKIPHVVLNHGKATAVIIGVDGREIVDLVREFEAKAAAAAEAKAAARAG